MVPVPRLEEAALEVEKADCFVIIGSSLNVYPAAGLIRYVRRGVPVYLIDPAEVNVSSGTSIVRIRKTASKGLAELKERLLHAE